MPPEDPPARRSAQTSDEPPDEFFDAHLVVGSNERDYCLKLFQLVGWFHDQDVFDQQWTLLVEGRWRLDGDNWEGSPPEKAHTVWVFQQEADRVKLVQYRDSKYADRTADKIMEIYYPYLRNLDKTPDCDPPY